MFEKSTKLVMCKLCDILIVLSGIRTSAYAGWFGVDQSNDELISVDLEDTQCWRSASGPLNIE